VKASTLGSTSAKKLCSSARQPRGSNKLHRNLYNVECHIKVCHVDTKDTVPRRKLAATTVEVADVLDYMAVVIELLCDSDFS
jgi:hypothetical protein